MTSSLPPNTFGGAYDFGTLGTIDPATGFFRSIHIKQQSLGGTWAEIYNKFYTSAGGYLNLETIEYPAGKSALKIFDTNEKFLISTKYQNGGVDSTLADFKIGGGYTYVMGYGDTPIQPSYDLGIFVSPFAHDAYVDHDRSLGTDPNLSFDDTMATVYDRGLPTDRNSKQMAVLSTTIAKDQTDVFQFDISKAGSITIGASGDYAAVVLSAPSQGLGNSAYNYQFTGTKTFNVNPGHYVVTVYDTESDVFISGTGGGFTRSNRENLDDYNLSVKYTAGTTPEPDPDPDTDLPELYMEMVGIGSRSVARGGVTDGTFVFHNTGEAVNGAKVGFYVSKNDVISTADRLVGTITLGDLTSTTAQQIRVTGIDLPYSMKPGKYYLGAIIDYDDTIAEINDGNNGSEGYYFRVRKGRGDREAFIDNDTSFDSATSEFIQVSSDVDLLTI